MSALPRYNGDAEDEIARLDALLAEQAQQLNAERLEVIGAVARKEAAQREAAMFRELHDMRGRVIGRLMEGFQQLAAAIEDYEPTNADHIPSLVSVLKFQLAKVAEQAKEIERLKAELATKVEGLLEQLMEPQKLRAEVAVLREAQERLMVNWRRDIAPIDRERFCGHAFEQSHTSVHSCCATCELRESVHLKLEVEAALTPPARQPDPLRDCTGWDGNSCEEWNRQGSVDAADVPPRTPGKPARTEGQP